MASKIQQLLATVAGANLTNLELEAVKCFIDSAIEARPSTTCHLLNLPQELRDRIYEFTATAEIHEFGFPHRSGLLAANKQIRQEFMAVLYNHDKVLHARYYSRKQKKWLTIRSKVVLKAILDQGEILPKHMLEKVTDYVAGMRFQLNPTAPLYGLIALHGAEEDDESTCVFILDRGVFQARLVDALGGPEEAATGKEYQKWLLETFGAQ